MAPITLNGAPLGTGDLVNSAGFLTGPLAAVATTGRYTDLLNVPTKLSQFTNDVDFSTGGGTTDQVNADWNATDGIAEILNRPSRLSDFVNDLTSPAGDWLISNDHILEFGNGIAKEQNAGKIGYETFTQGALDIVGAGEDSWVPSRVVKIWDNVIIPGSLQVSTIAGDLKVPDGNISCSGSLQVSTIAGDLKVPDGNISCSGITADHVVCTMDSSFPRMDVENIGVSKFLYAAGAHIDSLFVPKLGASDTDLGNTHIFGDATIDGVVQVGSDKATAGVISCQRLTPDAMDIIGVGPEGSSNLKLWDNVRIPGTLAVTGNTSVGALTASSISTPALTVAGTQVYPQVNADWNATNGSAQILNKPTKLTQFTNDLTGSSAA